VLPLWTVKAMGRQLLAEPSATARRHPQAQVAHQDAKWWTLSHYDSAVVSNAEGTKVAWYQRRPEQVRSMLARSVRTHLDLYRHWNRLRDEYRAAADEITSFPAWERTFAANPAPVRPGIDDRDGAEESSDATSESASA
jgi:galactofuranosylgalactofuranosylrhamnosyl-N-acetylglucosaminyl-diphospho-decaprenol beta-1,5/1,6-galactofuranosyltransferase